MRIFVPVKSDVEDVIGAFAKLDKFDFVKQFERTVGDANIKTTITVLNVDFVAGRIDVLRTTVADDENGVAGMTDPIATSVGEIEFTIIDPNIEEIEDNIDKAIIIRNELNNEPWFIDNSQFLAEDIIPLDLFNPN